MNFDFDEKQLEYFEKIRKAVIESGYPKEAGFENEITDMLPLISDIETRKTIMADIVNRLAEIGYSTLLNTDLNTDDKISPASVSVNEMAGMCVLAQTCPELFLPIGMSLHIFGRLIKAFGNPEQKEDILPKLAKGENIAAVAMSETSMNIENDPMQTAGIPEDDNYLVSGEKNYVINGSIADLIAVIGMISETPAAFIIGKDSEGLEIKTQIATMGYNAASIASMTIADCKIPAAQTVKASDGKSLFATLKKWENQVLTAASVGMMKACFEKAKAYADEHRTGNKPIIAYQEIAFKLSDMLTMIHTAELMAYKAAWYDQTDNSETIVMTECAKVFCTEAAEKVAGEAMQILSGRGYISGNVVESAYRNAKYAEIAGTSSEIARVKIGDAVMKSGR